MSFLQAFIQHSLKYDEQLEKVQENKEQFFLQGFLLFLFSFLNTTKKTLLYRTIITIMTLFNFPERDEHTK